MYYTKDQGKNNFHRYRYNMSVKNSLLLNTENEIRNGLKQQQFEVFFQPQINLDTGDVVGLKALLRWNHPRQGLLSPSHFLKIAEESSLICELGEWVLGEVLKHMRDWQEAGIRLP